MSAAFWDTRLLDPALAAPDAFDADGFLRDPSRWTPALGDEIGRCLGLVLTPAHHAVLLACRDFLARYQRMPTTRVFVRHLVQTPDLGIRDSSDLMQLFPDTPMRLVALCAGLPKPPNCF